MEEKKMDDQKEDKMETALKILLENQDDLLSLATILDTMGKSGMFKLIGDIVKDYFPSDPTYLVRIIGSESTMRSVGKLFNILPALLNLMQDERTNDIVKEVAFNVDGLSETLLDGAKNPERFGVMKLMSILKDPEVASGMTALINVLKFLGKILRNVEEK
ncbi:MAG: DUF1641 domain-containing protein [Candidatus Thermoplasmatota archaeon]|jgi:uncharacterized protein YjgD (DUF1641 family)|nr:DUF1641 domain-containing protein [Candidatus Thermoplasmatota archaeon]